MRKVLLTLVAILFFPILSTAIDYPLKEGMPNTITLENGDVVFNLAGEWDAIFEHANITKDIIQITQNGTKFIGIKLIGNQWVPAGSESIRGELYEMGFKIIETYASLEGWVKPKEVIVGENCSSIVIKSELRTPFGGSGPATITLTRKQ